MILELASSGYELVEILDARLAPLSFLLTEVLDETARFNRIGNPLLQGRIVCDIRGGADQGEKSL